MDGYDPFSEFCDELIIDDDWTPQTYAIIKKEIEDGNTLIGAAAQAGISKKKIERWMKNDLFSDLIDSIDSRHVGEIYKNIERNLEGIEDPKSAADTYIKFLERRDSKFGTKNLDIKDHRERETVSPAGIEKVKQALEDTLIVEEDDVKSEDSTI